MVIDSATIESWIRDGVSRVLVRFVSGGCAGTRVEVLPSPSSVEGLEETDVSGIRVFFAREDGDRWKNARLTKVVKPGGKISWILTHPGVARRCGCGSSFSFDPDDGSANAPKIDHSKLESLRRLGLGRRG